MNSLRWKLIAGILASLTFLLGSGGMVTYFNIKQRLYAEFDRHLVQRAALLAAMIEEEEGIVHIEWLEEKNDPLGHLRGIEYFSVWNQKTGELLAASRELHGDPLPALGGLPSVPQVRAVILPDDRPGRCAGLEFNANREWRGDEEAPPGTTAEEQDRSQAAASETRVQLVVAQADTVQATLAAIRRPLYGLWAGCTLAGGLFIFLVVRRSLEPLEELKAQINRLQEGVSGQRIALLRQPDELKPVTVELNRLLERVERMFVHERTLTSNVAHELRTPVAGLLSTLEVTLHRLRSPEEYRESTEECFEIAKRMHWLVNNLLSITRLEAGNVQLQHQRVALGEALTEWWKPFSPRAEENKLRVEWDIEPGAALKTDPEFLRVVVTNLFDNAASYTPEGGTIRIEADIRGNISVANQAIELTPQAAERVFDPFWRQSESRDETGTHAGLGLSLCKKITELLGGRISAQVQDAESLFVVRLEMAG